MGKRTVSAKEVMEDIRAGMNDAGLMEKYGLSAKGLASLFKKLVDAGALQREALEAREQRDQGTVGIAWTCPACGMPQTREFDECPECGLIVTRFAEMKERAKKQHEAEDAKAWEFTTDHQSKPQGAKPEVEPAASTPDSLIAEATESYQSPIPSDGIEGPRRKVLTVGLAVVLLLVGVVFVLTRFSWHEMPSGQERRVLDRGSDESTLRSQKHEMPADLEKRVVAHYELQDPCYVFLTKNPYVYYKMGSVRVVKASKGVIPKTIADAENPRDVYCLRLSYRLDRATSHEDLLTQIESRKYLSFSDDGEKVRNVMVWVAQSGKVTLTSITPCDYFNFASDRCPEHWDKICPFLCEK